jgi:uncharacterized protein YuzE
MRNKNQIKYFFDKEADILYFSQRKPSSKEISREIGEGIIVRIDPATKKIVGFTILNFLKRGSLRNKTIKLPLKAEFELIK